MNFFEKIASEATDFIKENPDKINAFKQQAAGFVKSAAEKEAEKDEEQRKKNGGKATKQDEVKDQILGFLSNLNIDGDEAEDEAAAPAKPQRPPGKPSYLIKKDDDKDEAVEEPAAAPEPPKKRPPKGKPSYLIKKTDPEDE